MLSDIASIEEFKALMLLRDPQSKQSESDLQLSYSQIRPLFGLMRYYKEGETLWGDPGETTQRNKDVAEAIAINAVEIEHERAAISAKEEEARKYGFDYIAPGRRDHRIQSEKVGNITTTYREPSRLSKTDRARDISEEFGICSVLAVLLLMRYFRKFTTWTGRGRLYEFR